MSNHYYRMPLPVSGDFIPATFWPTKPTPDVNRRDSAFTQPTMAEATARRPRWSYNKTTKVLTSRYLTALDARELNSMLSDVWSKHGEDSVSMVQIHIHPTWCQDHAGVLRAYGVRALHRSGI
jgi:hypothetical protein